jgi:hypothetical protein
LRPSTWPTAGRLYGQPGRVGQTLKVGCRAFGSLSCAANPHTRSHNVPRPTFCAEGNSRPRPIDQARRYRGHDGRSGFFSCTARVSCTSRRNSNLTGSVLSKAQLGKAGFQRAKLVSVNLDQANLDQADLTEADLTNSSLVGASLRQANLNGAILTGADFGGADFLEADDLKPCGTTSGRFIRRCTSASMALDESAPLGPGKMNWSGVCSRRGSTSRRIVSAASDRGTTCEHATGVGTFGGICAATLSATT